jgi:tetratricopeptide (TPR) repeat protein
MNEIQLFKNLIAQGNLSKAKKIADKAKSQKELLYAVIAESYLDQKDIEKAKKFFSRSILIDPCGPACYGLGKIQLSENRFNEALSSFQKCLSLNGFEIAALYKMAVIYRLQGNHEQALKCCEMLIKMGEDNAKSNINMAVILSDMGHYYEADPYYKKAFELSPNDNLIRFNYSMHLLHKGEFEEGFKHYETRKWCCKPPGEEWKGEEDQNILVIPEQGHGDMLQFVRFIPQLKKRAKKVILLCDKALVRLMQSMPNGADEVIEFNAGDEFEESQAESSGDNVSFGKYIRVMSVPRVLGLKKSDVPQEKYLAADPVRSKYWADKIKCDGLKVGICWQGGKRNDPEMISIDKRRSIALSEFEPILHMENIKFFSLQQGDDQAKNYPMIIDHMKECGDFLETAALIENLDLVIAVDTAVAHLAGALGKPVWVLSRRGGCWRWEIDGPETFWYPSMKIVRQSKMQGWEAEIEQIKSMLSAMC